MLSQRVGCGPVGLAARPKRASMIVNFQKAPASQRDAVSVAEPRGPDASSVVLRCNGLEERMRLVNNKIQLAAVKEAFNLKTVKLDGCLEPCDAAGFTIAEFAPGQCVQVSGSPSAEMEALQAEIGGLRAELAALQDLLASADLRSLGSLGSQLDLIGASYDDMRRACSLPTEAQHPLASADDVAIIKRLLAQVVIGYSDTPKFAATSKDGFSFDVFYEGQLLARDVLTALSGAAKQQLTEAAAQGKHRSGRANRHFHDSTDMEEVIESFHAT